MECEVEGGGDLKKGARRGRHELPPPDPRQFEDPIAMLTSWLPLRKKRDMGRRIEEVGSLQMAFTLPRGQIGTTYFGCMGGCAALGIVGGILHVGSLGEDLGFWLAAFGIFMLLPVGFLIWYHRATPPITFDKRRGSYWTGRSTRPPGRRRSTSDTSGDTKDIHAIQILARLYRGEDRPMLLYELNLVFSDGKRVSLIDSVWPSAIRDDATRLSAFLERPVWDGATHVEGPEMDGGRIAELFVDHHDDPSHDR
jgi:hypothetical protein